LKIVSGNHKQNPVEIVQKTAYNFLLDNFRLGQGVKNNQSII